MFSFSLRHQSVPICQAINPLLKLIPAKTPHASDLEGRDFPFTGQPRNGKRMELEDLRDLVWGQRFDDGFHGRASWWQGGKDSQIITELTSEAETKRGLK